jgi:formate dehydrogenase subunit delta
MSNAQHGGARNLGASPEDAPGEDRSGENVQHGSTEHIIRMANDIGSFFRAEPDRQVALDGVANHMNKFWTRRMRQKILDYLAQGGNELDELPRAALAQVVVSPASSSKG